MSFKDVAQGDLTIPSNLTASAFGKVNVRRTPAHLEVRFTVLMTPQGKEAEGWQTGIAIDGSHSMKRSYGNYLQGRIPDDVLNTYRQRGWLRTIKKDGKQHESLTTEAQQDALQRNFLQPCPNLVEPLAQRFISYLADELDADGGTTLIYWACGDGSQFEVLGDFTAAQCKDVKLTGPKKYGSGTKLLPAMHYFIDRFVEAPRGMYIFLTDGSLEDLEEVKGYTRQLAQDIKAKRRHPVKCVLVGIGEFVDEGQMAELDDLDTGTDVDIWDHKVAKDMRDLVEIFAEVVDENVTVAPSGIVYDSHGQVAARFTDGLPAVVSLRLPVDAEWFELEVGGNRIRQTLLLPQLA